MNFKMSRFLQFIISFIIATFFLIFGLFSLILPWSHHLQNATIKFILENTLIFSLFGLGFLLVGISLMMYSFFCTRHKYIHIQTGARAVSMDENLAHQYLESYWKSQFPNTVIPFQLSVKNKSLQIVTQLPSFPVERQKVILEKIKQDFADIFGRDLGYPNDVHLFVSFEESEAPLTPNE